MKYYILTKTSKEEGKSICIVSSNKDLTNNSYPDIKIDEITLHGYNLIQFAMHKALTNEPVYK